MLQIFFMIIKYGKFIFLTKDKLLFTNSSALFKLYIIAIKIITDFLYNLVNNKTKSCTFYI